MLASSRCLPVPHSNHNNPILRLHHMKSSHLTKVKRAHLYMVTSKAVLQTAINPT